MSRWPEGFQGGRKIKRVIWGMIKQKYVFRTLTANRQSLKKSTPVQKKETSQAKTYRLQPEGRDKTVAGSVSGEGGGRLPGAKTGKRVKIERGVVCGVPSTYMEVTGNKR